MKCVFSGGEMYRRVLRVVRFGEIFFSGEILIWGDSACQPAKLLSSLRSVSLTSHRFLLPGGPSVIVHVHYLNSVQL